MRYLGSGHWELGNVTFVFLSKLSRMSLIAAIASTSRQVEFIERTPDAVTDKVTELASIINA